MGYEEGMDQLGWESKCKAYGLPEGQEAEHIVPHGQGKALGGLPRPSPPEASCALLNDTCSHLRLREKEWGLSKAVKQAPQQA